MKEKELFTEFGMTEERHCVPAFCSRRINEGIHEVEPNMTQVPEKFHFLKQAFHSFPPRHYGYSLPGDTVYLLHFILSLQLHLYTQTPFDQPLRTWICQILNSFYEGISLFIVVSFFLLLSKHMFMLNSFANSPHNFTDNSDRTPFVSHQMAGGIISCKHSGTSPIFIKVPNLPQSVFPCKQFSSSVDRSPLTCLATISFYICQDIVFQMLPI